MYRMILAFVLLAAPALAADGKTVIVSPPGKNQTIGKVDGEMVFLKDTPTGTVGKIGKDKVITHTDGKGNTLGKVGDKKMFCHSNPATGVTICK